MHFTSRAYLSLCLLSASAFAGGDGSNVILVDSLPMVLKSACYEEVLLQASEDQVAIELYGESENMNELYLARTVELQGAKAHKVRSVEVTVLKSGWFPKCGITIR
jgi:hypothetical protein